MISEAIAASIGGAISAGILYPIDVRIKQLQLSQNDSNSNSSHSNAQSVIPIPSITFVPILLRRQIQRLLQKHYWYGIEVAVVQNAIEKFIYVMAYTTLKRYHDQLHTYYRTNRRSSGTDSHPHETKDTTMSVVLIMMIHILYGYMAQWVHLPVTIPLEMWKTQIQIYNHNNTQPPITTSDDGDVVTSNTKWEILRRIIYPPKKCHDGTVCTTTASTKHYFPMHLYSGISSYLILCWKPAIQYTIYESIKRVRIQQLQRQRQLGTSHPNNNNNNNHQNTTTTSTTTTTTSTISWMESFLIAIIARSISTIIVYPYIRRRLLQLQSQSRQQAPTQKNQATTATISSNTSAMNTTNTECVLDQNDVHETQVRPKKQPPTLQVVSQKIVKLLLQYRQPNILSLQWIRYVLQSHFDSTSYYGIGPELVRGAISSVISFIVQEYILQKNGNNQANNNNNKSTRNTHERMMNKQNSNS